MWVWGAIPRVGGWVWVGCVGALVCASRAVAVARPCPCSRWVRDPFRWARDGRAGGKRGVGTAAPLSPLLPASLLAVRPLSSLRRPLCRSSLYRCPLPPPPRLPHRPVLRVGHGVRGVRSVGAHLCRCRDLFFPPCLCPPLVLSPCLPRRSVVPLRFLCPSPPSPPPPNPSLLAQGCTAQTKRKDSVNAIQPLSPTDLCKQHHTLSARALHVQARMIRAALSFPWQPAARECDAQIQ